MQHKWAVEAVDWSLQDFLQSDEPFGGKVVVFGGHFRHTFPVVAGASILDQGWACMINSSLWDNVQTYHLMENLRLCPTTNFNCATDCLAFFQWLLSVGEGSTISICWVKCLCIMEMSSAMLLPKS